jgi:hypothetical protein
LGDNRARCAAHEFLIDPASATSEAIKRRNDHRGTITPDDLELLRDHIELTIKALARKAKAVEQ